MTVVIGPAGGRFATGREAPGTVAERLTRAGWIVHVQGRTVRVVGRARRV